MELFFANVDWLEILQAVIDTLWMLGVSVLFSALIGTPLGIVMYLTSRGHILQSGIIYSIISFIVNVLRSIPFIILLIMMMPITILLVGTSLGAKGVIPPLIVGAFPFFAKLVENALQKIDNGIIDMAKSYGATTWQIVWHILLPETFVNILSALTVTAIALVSYTAMAGVVGGGGLGDLAIRYGYQRFETNIMLITVVLLVVLVQIIQLIGDKLVGLFKKP
ncbi:MAG: ABC transporter permease [Burkholderiales bacterium]|nr:ABC transporter permease [Burkholderiales bacterium]